MAENEQYSALIPRGGDALISVLDMLGHERTHQLHIAGLESLQDRLVLLDGSQDAALVFQGDAAEFHHFAVDRSEDALQNHAAGAGVDQIVELGIQVPDFLGITLPCVKLLLLHK